MVWLIWSKILPNKTKHKIIAMLRVFLHWWESRLQWVKWTIVRCVTAICVWLDYCESNKDSKQISHTKQMVIILLSSTTKYNGREGNELNIPRTMDAKATNEFDWQIYKERLYFVVVVFTFHTKQEQNTIVWNDKRTQFQQMCRSFKCGHCLHNKQKYTCTRCL